MHKVIVLQARLASSRFPRKVLAELGGKSVLENCIERLRAAKHADEVCVAIPSTDSENELAEAVAKMNVTLVRGSESDVLGRYIQSAYQTKADIVVRATADNPLVSAENIDLQIEALLADPEVDYVWTEGLPIGVSVETMRLKTLEKLDYLARHQDMREHVTLYLRKNPGPFVIRNIEAPAEHHRPEYRLSLDTPRDYELFQKIYEKLGGSGSIDLSKALALIDGDAELQRLATPEVGIGVAS
jgi:spore coat polysaccharide biosynthesis protein SpsF